jgi:hypothetical protein
MQPRPTQSPLDESSVSLWAPSFCLAMFKTGWAAAVSVNKSSSASTWPESSRSSTSVSKGPFICSRTWFNHVILKFGWSARSFMTSRRKALNRIMPSKLHRLSSEFSWFAGSDLYVLVYIGTSLVFQCSGIFSSLRTKRISLPDIL